MIKKQILSVIATSICIVIGAMVVVQFMYIEVEKAFLDAVASHVQETIKVVRDLGVGQVDRNLRELKLNVAEKAIQFSDDILTLGDEQIMDRLSNTKASEYGFDYYFLTDGKAIGKDHETAEWINSFDFSQVYENKEAILVSPEFDHNRTYTLLAVAPVYSNGEIKGLLVERIDGFCLSKWIKNIQFTAGTGVAYLINGQGRNIATSREENYDWITGEYNSIKMAELNGDEETISIANLERRPLEGETGIGSYGWENQTSHAAFAPLTEMEGAFFIGYYESMLKSYIKDITLQSGTVSRPVVIIFFICLAMGIVLMFYKIHRIKHQHNLLQIKNLEIQNQAQEIAISEERFRLALERTNDIIFEYHIGSDSIMCFSNQNKVKHYDLSVDTIALKDSLVYDAVITKSSFKVLENALIEIRKGNSKAECILQAESEEHIKWFKMTLSAVPTLDGKPTRAIGILEDITKEKEGEIDLLTQLLTKSATTKRILSELSTMQKGDSSVFIIFDVDYFKDINDTYGHPVGDITLKMIANVIKHETEDSDVVGRFGGDEFCVFSCGNIDAGKVEETVDLICKQVKEIAVEGCENFSVSCSCGFTISNSSLRNFEKIFRNADNALYDAKKSKRGSYKFI